MITHSQNNPLYVLILMISHLSAEYSSCTFLVAPYITEDELMLSLIRLISSSTDLKWFFLPIFSYGSNTIGIAFIKSISKQRTLYAISKIAFWYAILHLPENPSATTNTRYVPSSNGNVSGAFKI